MAHAALISPRWLNACGKFPIISPAERLSEGAGPLVPAALQDGRPDLAADSGPAVHPVLGAELACQDDRAVQRHPAHQLGIGKVAELAADFPDALVLFPLPAGGDGQELLGDRI